jgi:hypothetical protein
MTLNCHIPRRLTNRLIPNIYFQEILMFRTGTCLLAALVLAGSLVAASAQTAAPASEPRPSKMKLTKDRLKEMRANWGQNKGKLKACQKDVKAKGLAGDDRWFYIEECMGKS